MHLKCVPQPSPCEHALQAEALGKVGGKGQCDSPDQSHIAAAFSPSVQRGCKGWLLIIAAISVKHGPTTGVFPLASCFSRCWGAVWLLRRMKCGNKAPKDTIPFL